LRDRCLDDFDVLSIVATIIDRWVVLIVVTIEIAKPYRVFGAGDIAWIEAVAV
jgi:hypothetical protein